MNDIAASFQAGSGIDPAKFYTFMSTFLMAAALTWVMWVVWRTWKSTQLKKLDQGDLLVIWVTALIIVGVLGILVVY